MPGKETDKKASKPSKRQRICAYCTNFMPFNADKCPVCDSPVVRKKRTKKADGVNQNPPNDNPKPTIVNKPVKYDPVLMLPIPDEQDGDNAGDTGGGILPADLADKNAKEMAAMANKSYLNEGQTPPDFNDPVPGRLPIEREPARTPAAEPSGDEPSGDEPSKDITPLGEDRDAVIARIAKEQSEKRYSWGKTRLGELVVNNTKFDDSKIVPFLEGVARTHNISRSAIAVKISPRTVYKLMQTNEAFRDAVNAARQICADEFNQFLMEYGWEGMLTEKRDTKNDKFYVVKERNDKAMELFAKLINPELRTGQQSVNVGIEAGDKDVVVNFRTPEEAKAEPPPEDTPITIDADDTQDASDNRA